jgi:hypothetical protein
MRGRDGGEGTKGKGVLGVRCWGMETLGKGNTSPYFPQDRKQIKNEFLIFESAAQPRFQKLSFGFY